jgi:YfiH family protein
MHRGDTAEAVAENYRILGKAVGFEPSTLVLTRQIHSDIVRRVGKADCNGLDHRDYPECDGLITNEPGVGLVVFTADCTPILLHDPVTGAVGAAHAGWRGTAADIAGKTVQAMVLEFGCDPKNIRAAIGPNIGGCCFQTDADVPQAMYEVLGEAAKPWIRRDGEKYYVNLKEINALLLRRAGVEQVEISTECTACAPQRFWSHRVTRGVRGSQGAVILCQGVDR